MKIMQAMKVAPPPGKANAKAAKGANNSVAKSADIIKPKATCSGSRSKGTMKIMPAMKAAPPPRRRLCPGKANATTAKGANSSVAKSRSGSRPKGSRKGQGTEYLQKRLGRAVVAGRAEMAVEAAVDLKNVVARMEWALEVAVEATTLGTKVVALTAAVRQAKAAAEAAEARVAMAQETSDATLAAAVAASKARMGRAVEEERQRGAAALAHEEQRHRDWGYFRVDL